uniref:C-type lectin domain-containing protein n=1 Tax=Knipowitschia caucasica TaxID=637954 RepID=A0AAV2KF68_KNICA
MHGRLLVLLLLTPAVVSQSLTACSFLERDFNWSTAQTLCHRSNGTDLLSLDLVSLPGLSFCTGDLGMVWTSLRRDTLNDSAWFWDNTIIAAGTEDVSSSLSWTEEGSGGHCASIKDSTWYSRRCSERRFFYCSNNNSQHEYVELNMSWEEARDYCQRDSRTLSSPHTDLEAQDIEGKKEGWVGLYRVGGDTWAWAERHNLSYTAWGPGEPVTSDCGAFSVEQQKWKSFPCERPLRVACHNDNLEVVTERKSWEEALQHCAGRGKRLVVLNNMQDYQYVRKRIYQTQTDQVWVGVRFLAGRWWWVDGSPVQEQLYPQCPEQYEACGTLSKRDNTMGLTQDCSRRLNFVCN